MFIGHYAVALAAKRAAPRTSLGTLFAAATLADLVWPAFVLTGWERVRITGGPNPFLNLTFDAYPISHSLLTLLAWAALFALWYRARTSYAHGALIVALLVVSHWVLDWVTHVPDMPLYPGGGPRVGLGLWNHVGGTVLVEAAMFGAALWIYLEMTRARDAVGRYGFGALIALLVASYAASLFSPPPPTTTALGIGGLLFGWLFVAWAGWGDKHREVVPRRHEATFHG
ncbi:MAG TPA: hypothetical protein VM716_08505 [Gemmatimonadales bacterium]|nr:hypothetical protein [Gemmatimonadales bacterium]